MVPADATMIDVEVAFSPHAGAVQRLALTLPVGSTVGAAIAATGWDLPPGLRVGVWGRTRTAADVLRDRDRVELYRALTVDPKEARRKRYRSRGAVKAGSDK